MKKNSPTPGPSLFDLAPTIKHGTKVVSTKKKMEIAFINDKEMSERGLNGVWKNFGDFIENERGNSTPKT